MKPSEMVTAPSRLKNAPYVANNQRWTFRTGAATPPSITMAASHKVRGKKSINLVHLKVGLFTLSYLAAGDALYTSAATYQSATANRPLLRTFLDPKSIDFFSCAGAIILAFICSSCACFFLSYLMALKLLLPAFFVECNGVYIGSTSEALSISRKST